MIGKLLKLSLIILLAEILIKINPSSLTFRRGSECYLDLLTCLSSGQNIFCVCDAQELANTKKITVEELFVIGLARKYSSPVAQIRFKAN